jgi:hypothetical protein
MTQKHHSWTYISKNVSQDTIDTLAHSVVLTIAKLWDQSICPLINKWIKKMYILYIYMQSSIIQPQRRMKLG